MFVFLLLEEHPYGREMLHQLLDGGFKPELILQEAAPLADLEREKFLERMRGHPVAATVEAQAAEHGLRVVSVAKHDDEHSLGPVRDVSPDLLVLGGTRIIRGALLESAPDGVLNSHPGLLPDCRGSASPAWSVYHDIPIGSSCHFCSAAIDEGDMVGRRRVAVRRG